MSRTEYTVEQELVAARDEEAARHNEMTQLAEIEGRSFADLRAASGRVVDARRKGDTLLEELKALRDANVAKVERAPVPQNAKEVRDGWLEQASEAAANGNPSYARYARRMATAV